MLSSVAVTTVDGKEDTLHNLTRAGYLLCTDVSNRSPIIRYAAVMDSRSELVNVGEFVKVFETSDTPEVSISSTFFYFMTLRLHVIFFIQTVEYGKLVCCFTNGEQQFCVLQLFERVETCNQSEPLLNPMDCPLLLLLSVFKVIFSEHIISAVSIMHECSSLCTYTQCSTSYTVERESVTTNTITFKHDFCNKLYCLNVYCLKS